VPTRPAHPLALPDETGAGAQKRHRDVNTGKLGIVRITRWLGRDVAGRLARWLKFRTAVTAFRRLSSSALCGSEKLTHQSQGGPGIAPALN
jgi:hypothetical protein